MLAKWGQKARTTGVALVTDTCMTAEHGGIWLARRRFLGVVVAIMGRG